MAAEERRVGSPCDEDDSETQLQELLLTTGNGTILCDVSTPSHRPFVPPSSSLHNLSHPGSLANDKLASDRFVWPGMHKDLKTLTRACSACQRSKIQRHNKARIGTFPGPCSRFSPVNLDIVVPVPLSNGCSYLLTGSLGGLKQFPCLTLLLQRCCTRIRTTAYHPAANGMVERFHRQLKAPLRAAADPENWTDHLPLVPLGIRSAFIPDLDCSAAEMVFGATVRLPGELISPTPRGPRPLRLISRRTWQRARTSSFDVIESAGPWNRPMTAHSECSVVIVDRLQAAVPDTPPDEPFGPLHSASPPAASIPPSRIGDWFNDRLPGAASIPEPASGNRG
nr:unnamed protein product [Spirometra erinaceieuropaei]